MELQHLAESGKTLKTVVLVLEGEVDVGQDPPLPSQALPGPAMLSRLTPGHCLPFQLPSPPSSPSGQHTALR